MERRNLPTVRHLESETAGHLFVLPSRETRAQGLLFFWRRKLWTRKKLQILIPT